MMYNKAKSFSKFLALAKRFQAANLNNYVKIAYYKETGHFQAAFFALVGLRNARRFVQSSISIDSTYTSSKF